MIARRGGKEKPPARRGRITAPRPASPIRRTGAGVCKHRGGDEHRGREDRFASRSGHSPVGNRIGIGFPCSATIRSCSAFSTGLLDLQDGQDRFAVPCSGAVAGCGAEPRQQQTKNRTAACRWMPRSKRKRLCVQAGLCVPFKHGAWGRLDSVAPSPVRAKTGSGVAPARARRGGGRKEKPPPP